MKTKFIYTIALLAIGGSFLQSCSDGYDHYDGIYISSTLGITPTYDLYLDDDFPKVLDLTVASSRPVANDVSVYLKADPSLIEDYNAKYGTNYLPIPEGAFILTHSVAQIKSGNFSTTEAIQFKVLSKEGFEIGDSYMMPVTISEISGGETIIEASRTIYIAINEVIVRSAVHLGTSGYLVGKFAEKTVVDGVDITTLKNLTLEIRCKVDRYVQNNGDHSFNGIMGLEENFAVRLSSFNEAGGRVEVMGANMGDISGGIPYPLNQWGHIAATYEGDDDGNGVVSIYVDGELQISSPVTRAEARKYIDLTYRYGTSSTANGYDYMVGNNVSSRYINGAVSEGRVWVRTLTQAEIRNNMCAVNPKSEGLIAYWYFDEEGTTFEDATGNGYDLVRYSGSLTYQEVRCPEL
ncbi:MAG: DUF1735 and LamG domain-containing protein [Alistipes sp.]|nr:DUF1735 and LamG domain-containing protein [Alistipes sp.]